MDSLNPGEMVDSLDAVGFQGGEIDIYNSQLNIKDSMKDILGSFNKQEFLEKVASFELSDDVKYFADEYERVINERPRFLWKWVGTVFKEASVTLSTVDNDYFDSITDNKIILTMLDAIIDDAVDVHKDKELLKKITDIFNENDRNDTPDDDRILLIRKIWKYLNNQLGKYPRYEEFKDIFMYDFQQFLNAMHYTCVINNHPNMINIQEMENYDCHNMIVFLYNGIDLMVSPDFNKNDLPHLRTAFWYAQQMARIGNWLSTWKREVKEKDISSGVFAYVFTNKVIDIDDIGKLPDDEIINRIENSGVNEYFMDIWKQNYAKLQSSKDKIKSVDMDAYIKGLEDVIKYHMASEGLK